MGSISEVQAGHSEHSGLSPNIGPNPKFWLVVDPSHFRRSSGPPSKMRHSDQNLDSVKRHQIVKY